MTKKIEELFKLLDEVDIRLSKMIETSTKVELDKKKEELNGNIKKI